MQTNNIFIFSRPIRSGKTTELFSFIKDKKNIGGILTPDDENGVRVMYDIAENEYQEFELPAGSEKLSLTIGKFLFSEEAFSKAKDIIAAQNGFGFFIIDEIGKFEIIQGQGFEPALSEIILSYQLQKQEGKLLLVIRDSLLHDAILIYNLQGITVLNDLSGLK